MIFARFWIRQAESQVKAFKLISVETLTSFPVIRLSDYDDEDCLQFLKYFFR